MVPIKNVDFLSDRSGKLHGQVKGEAMSRIHGFRRWSLIAAAVVPIALVGCGFQYTKNINKSLEGRKIPVTSIAVLPVPNPDYQPPESCMPTFSVKEWNASSLGETWNSEIQKTLTRKFPNQKWVFPSETDSFLLAPEHSLSTISALASEEPLRTSKVDASALESEVIKYEPLQTSQRLLPILQALKQTTGSNYAVFFLRPTLTGEIQTTYNAPMYGANGMMTGGGTSQREVYTADIQIQLWDCSTGQLLYSSGGWAKSGSPCFFVTPEESAIKDGTSDMLGSLTRIITCLLRDLNAPTRLALGPQ